MAQTKLMEAMDIVDRLDDEEFSQLIDYIRYKVKARRNEKSAKTLATLKVGDRVRIVGPTKPQYLAGMTGTIEKRRQTKLVVKLSAGPVGKFRDGKVICPASMLEKIG